MSIKHTQDSLSDYLKNRAQEFDGEESSKMNEKNSKKINLVEYDDEESMNLRNNLEMGTFHLKDGKLVEGNAETRQIALYSNWCASNADPQDLLK